MIGTFFRRPFRFCLFLFFASFSLFLYLDFLAFCCWTIHKKHTTATQHVLEVKRADFAARDFSARAITSGESRDFNCWRRSLRISLSFQQKVLHPLAPWKEESKQDKKLRQWIHVSGNERQNNVLWPAICTITIYNIYHSQPWICRPNRQRLVVGPTRFKLLLCRSTLNFVLGWERRQMLECL